MNDTVAEYPAETEGTGNEVLEPTLGGGGIKKFELTAEVTPWEVEPGTLVEAWTTTAPCPGRRSGWTKIKDAASEFLANRRSYEVFAVNPNADEVHPDGQRPQAGPRAPGTVRSG